MGPSIWSDEWESLGDGEWEGGVRSTRLPRTDDLGATVYELPPGARSTYHFHHGAEELLVVLRGRPTLRAPGGESELETGDVVSFPAGPDGAHEVLNRGEEHVRYLVASTRPSPEVVEYPDTRQITAQARTGSQTGERLWLIHDLGDS